MEYTIPYDSILLIGFGGPTPGCCHKYEPCPGEAYCFVEGIVGTAPSDAERVKEVAGHYAALGGFSPFNELTFQQADALQIALKERGVDLPIYAGMRNWSPYLHETLAEMVRDGRRRILGIIMSAYQTKASWERYQNDVSAAIEMLAGDRPEVSYLETQWHQGAGFINAAVDQIRAACKGMEPDRFAQTSLIFTAHAIPEPAARRSPYPQQFRETATTVAGLFGKDFDLAYQSAPDNPTVPWTGPDINDLIREKKALGVKDVIVTPIGFLCDHVEVLYDLDLEAKVTADDCGIGFIRPTTVANHPEFIGMLANLVCQRFDSAV